MEEVVMDPNVIMSMSEGKPYKSYKKTILGKLSIILLDPFSGKPISKLLAGDPNGKDKENTIIDIWNEREELFFKRSNKRHFDLGYLTVHTRKPEDTKAVSENEYTDEELETLINSKFLALQHKVNSMTSIAPIFRLINLARELEKSEKIINFLQSKLSEIQQKEYTAPEE